MLSNFRVERDGNFDYISTGTILIRHDVRVPTVKNILFEPVQTSGSIVYDLSSGNMYYSNGVGWTLFSAGGGNTFSNIGLGVGIYKQTVGNVVELKSIRSTGGVVVTDDIFNDSVGIFTSLNLLTPTTSTGDMIYADSASTVTRLPAGNLGDVLTISGGIPVWAPPASTTPGMANVGLSGVGIFKNFIANTYNLKNISSNDSSILVTDDIPNSTVNISTTLERVFPPTSTGQIIHSNSPSTYSALPLGAAGFVLTSNGSDVTWSPSASAVNPNLVVVTKNPGIGQFPNAFSAMASIPTIGPNVPSVTNPYVIYVYPGVYQEPGTVVFKEFVYLVGVDIGGVVFEPLNPGYNLFIFVRATSMSFCSVQNVVSPNVACVFDNAGSSGYFFELLHKVNFYDCKITCNSTLQDSFIYFEYVSFTNTLTTTNLIQINSTLNSTILSTENFFFNGPSTDAIIIDGTTSFLSCQACNLQGGGIGNAIHITNGGNVELRDTYISDFHNGILADLVGTNPRLEISGVSFGVNTLNLNIQNRTASGSFFGYSEYNKTVINPIISNTFFIANQNQQVITVAPKGGNFNNVYDAVQAINPVVTINITNLSTTITSLGLFTATLDTILISATGIPPATTVTFVDENTMTLSNPATATATVNAIFLRASASSPYVVEVQPGTYFVSSPIKVYDYVNINGIDRDTSIIVPMTPGTSLFEMYPNATLNSLTITGSDPVQYAVILPHNSNYAILKNLVFLNVNRGIEYTSITADFASSIIDCIFIGTTGDIAVNVINPGGFNLIIDINNIQCVQGFANFIQTSGPNSKISLRNSALGGDGFGNVVNILNGSIVNVQGMYLINWATVFSTGDAIPNTPYLAVTGLTFLNISGNILNITNPTTAGYFNGYVPYLKTSINPLSSFFITNKDTHIITVAKKGGDFSSVRAAVNSIVGATQTNVYIVAIGPGVFIENPITLSSYIGIRGSGYLATTIFTTSPTSPVITGADASTIENCAFSGATGVGGCAVSYSGTGTSPGSPFIVNNCVLANNTTLINVRTTVNSALMLLNNCLYGASFNATTGVTVTSTAGASTTLLLYNCIFQDLINPVPQTLLVADGTNALIAMSNTLVQLNGTNTSTAMRIQNGASTRIYGSTFVGLAYGIVSENVGPGPNVIIASSTFDDCDTILAINNPGTTGSFSGSIDITRVFINPASAFFVRDRVPTALIVSKKGSDFNTVISAINFINPSFTVGTTFFSNIITSAGLFNTSLEGSVVVCVGVPLGSTFTFVDPNTGMISNPATVSGSASAQFIRATVTNPFTIQLQPGIYNEPPLILPEYVSLIGVDPFSCIITPSVVTNTIISLSKNADLTGVNIRGATSGIGILVDSTQLLPTSPITNLNSVTISDCNTGILATSTTSRCEMSFTDIIIEGSYTTGLHIDGLLLNTVDTVKAYINGMICQATTPGTTCILIEGPNAGCVISGGVMDCEFNAVGVSISDGGSISMLSCEIKEATSGLINPAVGAGCIINATSLICRDNTTFDVNILHPATSGCLAMVIAERLKVFIDSLSPITVTYIDPVNSGTTIAGNIYVGSTNSLTTDISPMVQHGLNLGSLQGGLLSDGGGLNVSVASGVGYITQGTYPNQYVQKVVWLAGSIPIPASSTYYVYISSLGVITINLVKPTLEFVLLGRVTTDAVGVEILELSPMGITNLGNKYDDFHRNAIGSVVAVGLSVAGSVTRELTVGSGEYYYSGNVYNPSSSGPPAVYYQYNHVAGVFVHALGPASVENVSYDDLTNLVAIPAGEYVKHALYLSGDGVNQKIMLVIGQTTFAALPDAIAGVNPTPPQYFTEIVIPIAGVIVQEGNAAFINIIDRRPTITSSLSNLASTLVHGNLLGLLADDHPQYLLTDGSRILAGPMDFGGNNLSNIGTMNGVTIQTHASRHLPAGADPLTTAAPLANLSGTTTNATGTANSLSRSDHSHAVSTGVASTIIPNQANATGVSANIARADHIHNIPSGSVVSIGIANNSGAAASFSLSDHVHQGLHSINANVGTLRYGDVTLQQGNGVSISDTLGTFTISASSGTSEFYPSLPGGLFVAYTGGKLNIGGVVSTIAGGSVAVPIFSSGVVYINPSGTVTFTLGTINQNSWSIASFTTNGVSVTAMTDIRSYINNGVLIGSGKTILVDGVIGSDTTGYRQGTPFATIGAAIAVALSGDVIYISPGVYAESGLTIPDGVYIQGSGVNTCFVTASVVASNTMFTMGNNTSLAEMTVSLTSGTSGVILTGVLFPSTSTLTSIVKNIVCNVTNTTALISNIYGIRSNGTGAPASTVINVSNTNINVTSSSATSGIIRGVYVDNANTINVYDSVLSVLDGGGVSHYGIETAFAGAVMNMYSGRVSTTNVNNTYLQTLGTVNLYSVVGSDISTMFTALTNQIQFGNTNTTILSAPVPASDIILSLPIITDTLVAKTTTDILTNKTITSATNNISANSLKTTGTSVTVSTAAPPTTGQALVATSATTAGWSVPVITSGSFIDNVTFIVGNVDATKRIGFNDGPATSGVTLTLTNNQTTSQVLNFPNITSTDTLVVLSLSQTLTNKTLTLPIISQISNTGTLTLPSSTDTLVGKATSDVFTNKTITGATNTVDANALKTTGASVTVSTAAPPTTGQALVATSATTAAWSVPVITSGNFVDNVTFIVGNVDPTKRIGFNDGPATTGTTLTLTNNQTTSQILNYPNITATDTLVTTSLAQTLTNKTLTLPIIAQISNTGTLTLPSSTDTLVGKATSDILTNKTITGATNTVDANALKTTGASVTVSTSAPPSTGQTLVATSATTAAWSTLKTPRLSFDYPNQFTANSSAAFPASTAGIFYFSWKNSRYSTLTNGVVTYTLQTVSVPSFDIRFYDATNNVTLGSDLAVAVAGVRSFTIINPTTDALIVCQIRKTAAAGVNPIGVAVQWEWDL